MTNSIASFIGSSRVKFRGRANAVVRPGRA
jgi:hypothetical protein